MNLQHMDQSTNSKLTWYASNTLSNMEVKTHYKIHLMFIHEIDKSMIPSPASRPQLPQIQEYALLLSKTGSPKDSTKSWKGGIEEKADPVLCSYSHSLEGWSHC